MRKLRNFGTWIFVVSFLCLISNPSHSQTIGVVGDSLADEYFEDPSEDGIQAYDYAFNWLQQLVNDRSFDGGPTAQEAAQPGNTWGEPRRTGYEYNWARYGATSGNMIGSGQHTGLSSQIIANGIDYAVLAIGSNDFSPYLAAYNNIYWGNWNDQQIDTYNDQVLANIDLALTTILFPGVDLVLVNVPDYNVVPLVRNSYPNAVYRERVTNAIRKLNRRVEDLAREQGLILFDLYGLSKTIFGENFEPAYSTLFIGNVQINLLQHDTIFNSNPTAGFVHDSIHPHTHLQGVIANVILRALDVAFDSGINLFSEEEILSHAGIAYGGEDTLGSEIGEYSDFLVNFTKLGDLNSDGWVSIVDFLQLLADWGPCPDPLVSYSCEADLNGDHVVNGTDIMALFTHWGS